MMTSKEADVYAAVRTALTQATHPVLVLGYGSVVAQADAEIAMLARRLPALRVVATPKAKGIFPETHPQYLGVVGFAGHARAEQYLFGVCDLALIVGSRLGELTSNNWDARWQRLQSVRIDVADRCDSWCPSPFTLRGDARCLLRELTLGLPPSMVPSVVHASFRRLSNEVATDEKTAPIEPKDVMAYVNRTFPADGYIFSGIGNTMAWAVHYLRQRMPNRWHVNLCAGSMGHAIPAAMGAALTGVAAIAIVGDAEFLMTGYELHTAVENQLPVTVVVLNDAGHGMVRVGSKVHCNGHTPSFDFNTPVDVVDASRAQGAFAVRVTKHRDFVAELAASLVRTGPSVIDVPISPDLVPPLGTRLDSLSHAFGVGKEQAADVGR